MRTKKLAILALSLGMVFSMSSVSCGGKSESDANSGSSTESSLPEEVQGETLADENAWVQAITSTLEKTNASVLGTARMEERANEYYRIESGTTRASVADGKVYQSSTGTTSFHYPDEETGEICTGEEAFSNERYISFVDGTAIEWLRFNAGEWDCLPYHAPEEAFTATLNGLLNNMDVYLSYIVEQYAAFQNADGTYVYQLTTEEMVASCELKFVDGLLYSYVSEYTDTYIGDGVTITETSYINLVISYDNATVGELPPMTWDGSEGGEGESGGGEKPSKPEVVVCKHEYEDGFCMHCGEEALTDGLLFWTASDGNAYVQGYTGTDERVVIPSSYEGNPVKGILESALSGQTLITEVVISNGVERIDTQAFYNCQNLTQVVLPDSITSIGLKAFYYTNVQTNTKDELSYLGNDDNPYVFCLGTIYNNITSVTIADDCKVIGYNAFDNCTALTEVVIPNGVVSIGSYAFAGCTGLEQITIPDSVKSMDYKAFEECRLKEVYITDIAAWMNLTFGSYDANPVYKAKLYVNNELLKVLEVPKSIQTIADYAFYGCASLEKVVISDTVTTIGKDAFGGCSNITEVVIANSVTSIGDYAFASCSALEKITFNGKVAQWNEIIKGKYWKGSIKEVVCTDETITL